MSTSKTSGCGCGGSGQGGCGCGGGCGGGGGGSDGSAGGAGCGTACADGSFVRPNFFAGQLLTEEDLGALSRYVVDKHRLQNRHLFGEGVVCGLQVVCGPCAEGSGSVTVRPGHAIDCCGNDLVLDCEARLDLIAMARALRLRQPGGADCGDPCAGLGSDGQPRDGGRFNMGRGEAVKGEPVERRYGLYLRYRESESDPVTPYATDEPCAGAACVASRIREGVCFELRCFEEPPTQQGFLARALASFGDLTKAERLSAAMRALVESSTGTAGATAAQLVEARDALIERLENGPPAGDCRLAADVAALAMPAAGTSSTAAVRTLVTAYLRLLRDGICQAVLPPCPPCDDSAVLLAAVTLVDCKVTAICNLERRFVLSGPALRHWVPMDLLGDAVEGICCSPLSLRLREPEPNPNGGDVANPAPKLKASASASASTGNGKDDPNGGTRRDDLGDVIAQLVGRQLMTAFRLDKLKLAQLEHIADDLGELVELPSLDDTNSARTLRMLADPRLMRDTLMAAVTDSPAAMSASTAAASAASGTAAQPASSELAVKAAEAMAALETMREQNRGLQEQLAHLAERVAKLDGAPADASLKPAAGDGKKSKK